jgi:MFS family permease
MENYYGLLSGMAYTLPFSICSLSVAMLDGGFNRKKLLTGVSVAAAATMLVMGNVNSLACLAAMRVCHAAFNSTIQPLIYSLVGDYFPVNQRGMANAILQSASYIGIALSSISLALIN